MVLIVVYTLLVAGFGSQVLANCSQDTCQAGTGAGYNTKCTINCDGQTYSGRCTERWLGHTGNTQGYLCDGKPKCPNPSKPMIPKTGRSPSRGRPGSAPPRHGPPVRSKRWMPRKEDDQVIAEAVTEKRWIPSDISSDDAVLEKRKEEKPACVKDSCQADGGLNKSPQNAPCTMVCDGQTVDGKCLDDFPSGGYTCVQNEPHTDPGKPPSTGKPPKTGKPPNNRQLPGHGGEPNIPSILPGRKRLMARDEGSGLIEGFKRWLGFDTNGERGSLDASAGNLAIRDGTNDVRGARGNSRRWLRYNRAVKSGDAIERDQIRRDSSEEKRDSGIHILDNVPEHLKREYEQREPVVMRDSAVITCKTRFKAKPGGFCAPSEEEKRDISNEDEQHNTAIRREAEIIGPGPRARPPITVLPPTKFKKKKPAGKKRDTATIGNTYRDVLPPKGFKKRGSRSTKRRVTAEEVKQYEPILRRDANRKKTQYNSKRECGGNDPPGRLRRSAIYAGEGHPICSPPVAPPIVVGHGSVPGIGKSTSPHRKQKRNLGDEELLV